MVSCGKLNVILIRHGIKVTEWGGIALLPSSKDNKHLFWCTSMDIISHSLMHSKAISGVFFFSSEWNCKVMQVFGIMRLEL